MRTGILVHGCNLGAFQWRRISWGEAPYRFGRITRALAIVIHEMLESEQGVSALVFGTGVVTEQSPQRNTTTTTEAFQTRRLMFESLDRLVEFDYFRRVYPEVADPKFLDQLAQHLNQISFLAEDCQNTVEELRNAANIFRAQDVHRTILISSPVHLPRCLKEACVLASQGEWAGASESIYAAPSDTCYQGTNPKDVAIFEPPHRPDRPMYPIQQLVRRISKVKPDQMPRFLKELDELLEDFEA